MHYVYVLKLCNKQLYTGRTDNLKRRFAEHQSGGVKSTKHHRPVNLVFYEAFLTKPDAVRRERYLKTAKGKSTLRMMLRDSMNLENN